MNTRPAFLGHDHLDYLGVLAPVFRPPPLGAAAIAAALARPCWPGGSGPPLFENIRPGNSVCLVVSDQTRRTGADRVMPVLLAGLQARGCRIENLRVAVASGIHRAPTPAEFEGILGPVTARQLAGRAVLHDPDTDAGLVAVGCTRAGHPVRLARAAVEADRLILLGAASYHYHAGFGGGRKSLVPGLADRATIAWTHSLTLDPRADRFADGVEIGRLDGNPVAEAMLEAARLRPPDGIVNTVLAPDGALAGVFAGELDLAHRAACRLVEQLDRVDIGRPADLVVADAGNAATWIQAHKALFNASRAVADTGRIVLAAPCAEGLGNERFRHWITRPTLTELVAGLRASPEVNGQTALSTRLRGPQAILVTRLPARDAADLGIATAPTVAAAVARALADLARAGIRRPTCYWMPQAMSVVPFPVAKGEAPSAKR